MMHPNSDHVDVTIPQTQESTMIIPSKEEERLEKGIKYFSSKMFLIQLILAIVFSITEIIFGRQYNDQCPISPNIPLFLLVHGSTKLGWVACGIIAYIEAKFFSKSSYIRILMLINIIIQIIFSLFFAAWFITGNVWVWSVKNKVQSTDSTLLSTYCNSELYRAAEGLIISTYIVVGIITLLTIKQRFISKKLRTIPNK